MSASDYGKAPDARATAALAVAGVLEGRSLEDFAGDIADTGRDAGLTRAMVYGTVRELGSLRWLIKQMTKRMPDDRVTALIAVGLFQLRSMRVPPHAAVSETVSATGAIGRPKARGLVNAILRRYQREQEPLNAKLPADLDLPDWLAQQIRRDWEPRGAAIIDASLRPAPMVLRANARAGSRADALAALSAADLAAEAIKGGAPAAAIVLEDAVPVDALPGFDEGRFSVQDASAQCAAGLLAPADGEHILDACAAPGGKSAHLLELADITLTALDADASRLARVEQTLERIGQTADVRAGDASKPDTWWDGTPFDAILIDAPCSGTGVIRRHPDIPWLRRPSDIPALAERQRDMLAALWPLLKPGGRLVYATCSILTAENSDVISAFLAATPDASAQAIGLPVGELIRADRDPVGWRIAPGGAFDGFFYAKLTKIGVESPDQTAGTDSA